MVRQPLARELAGGEIDADPQRDWRYPLAPLLNLAASLGKPQSPMGRISPHSSASGMKSMGGINPRSG